MVLRVPSVSADARVKMYNCGFILNPACLAPRHTVEMAQKLQVVGPGQSWSGDVVGQTSGRLVRRKLKIEDSSKPDPHHISANLGVGIVPVKHDQITS